MFQDGTEERLSSTSRVDKPSVRRRWSRPPRTHRPLREQWPARSSRRAPIALDGIVDFVVLGPPRRIAAAGGCPPPTLLRRREPMLTAATTKCTAGTPARPTSGGPCERATPIRRSHRRLICRRRNTPSFGFPAFGFRYFSLSSQSSLHRSLTLLICYRSPVAYLALDEVYHPILCSSPNEHDS